MMEEHKPFAAHSHPQRWVEDYNGKACKNGSLHLPNAVIHESYCYYSAVAGMKGVKAQELKVVGHILADKLTSLIKEELSEGSV